MDAYWSVERCGWVPCPGRPDPLATPWSVHEQAEHQPVPDLPHQRAPRQERTDA